MKFGLKLWSANASMFKTAVDLIKKGVFDYIELTALPDMDLNFLVRQGVRCIIHVPNEYQGVNIGNIKAKDSLKSINFSLDCADNLSADYVILHPGTGSLEHARTILSKIKDDRILLENMPKAGLRGEECLGYSLESMLYLIKDSNFGLCLDFGHAVKASISLRRDYKEVISEFLKLKPKVFHISDGDLTSEKDDHLNIKEGQYDFDYFKRCIEKSDSNSVSIETPRRNPYSLEEDLRNIKILKSLWGHDRT